MGEATEGNHGEAAMLDLSELVSLEVLLVGALQRSIISVLSLAEDTNATECGASPGTGRAGRT